MSKKTERTPHQEHTHRWVPPYSEQKVTFSFILGGSEISTTTTTANSLPPSTLSANPSMPQCPATATLISFSARTQPLSGKSLGLGACCTCATSHKDSTTLASGPELPALLRGHHHQADQPGALACYVYLSMASCLAVMMWPWSTCSSWGSLARRGHAAKKLMCLQNQYGGLMCLSEISRLDLNYWENSLSLSEPCSWRWAWTRACLIYTSWPPRKRMPTCAPSCMRRWSSSKSWGPYHQPEQDGNSGIRPCLQSSGQAQPEEMNLDCLLHRHQWLPLVTLPSMHVAILPLQHIHPLFFFKFCHCMSYIVILLICGI